MEPPAARPGRAADRGVPSAWLTIAEPLTPDQVRAVCERLRCLVARSGAEVVECDLAGVVADLRALDALARLELTARRLGCELRFLEAPPDLADVVEFAGLADVLGCGRPSGVEARRKPEHREDPLRVQEEDDAADLSVGDVEDLE